MGFLRGGRLRFRATVDKFVCEGENERASRSEFVIINFSDLNCYSYTAATTTDPYLAAAAAAAVGPITYGVCMTDDEANTSIHDTTNRVYIFRERFIEEDIIDSVRIEMLKSSIRVDKEGRKISRVMK